jgi:hypothetical protein
MIGSEVREKVGNAGFMQGIQESSGGSGHTDGSRPVYRGSLEWCRKLRLDIHIAICECEGEATGGRKIDRPGDRNISRGVNRTETLESAGDRYVAVDVDLGTIKHHHTPGGGPAPMDLLGDGKGRPGTLFRIGVAFDATATVQASIAWEDAVSVFSFTSGSETVWPKFTTKFSANKSFLFGIRQLCASPYLNLFSHRFEVALHAVHADRDRIDERERILSA